jgi:hypothetical protein
VLILIVAHQLAARAQERGVGRNTVVIRVYNWFGVSDEQIRRAEEEATAIFEQAGITVVWRNCHVVQRASKFATDACANVMDSEEVAVRFIAARRNAAGGAGSLGFSYVDKSTNLGVLSTVYGNRVAAMASRAGVDASRLFGDTIAHEVGHLLLGSDEHSVRGLMRATWVDAEVRANAPADWFFSSDEAAQMRANMTVLHARTLKAGADAASPSSIQ